jgi:hypothetical protein
LDTHRIVRQHLIAAAHASFCHAHGQQGFVESREDALREIKTLKQLATDLDHFIHTYGPENHTSEAAGIDRRTIERFFEGIDTYQAESLVELLRRRIARQERDVRSTSAPATDHLSRRFIHEMRLCWRSLTRTIEPKSGGPVLIQLSIGIWRDCRFPIATRQLFEDWMIARFKACPLEGDLVALI